MWLILQSARVSTNHTGKTNPVNPRSWLGPDLMIGFVVSVGGEVYDEHGQEVQIGNPG